ncbi:MAG TPA: VOC family protein [Verrucomicrobiae bacterium]|jgi:catechol 2,3-dioxygenase-like lactoylglutathione lyase family enzyme|nr:VOC family protein [Verrucomicrobiae bacterium]
MSCPFTGTIVLIVPDVRGAVAWYTAKLDLRESKLKFDDGASGDVMLVSRDEQTQIVLSAEEGEPDRPILDTRSAAKSREWLLARGVAVGPVLTDRQGTHYMEMTDPYNNVIEICEEP